MTKESTRHTAYGWVLSAAIALVGSIILFDRASGINGSIWVALAVIGTLAARRSADWPAARAAMTLGLAAIVAAAAAARTTDVPVHAGIFWLTAILLAAFLAAVPAGNAGDISLFGLLTSPFRSAARVVTSSAQEVGLAFRAVTDSPSKAILRRVILVAPVVLLLLFLLGGADPVIQSAIETVQSWAPQLEFTPRAIFFVVLFIVMIGASSRLPDVKWSVPAREPQLRNWPSAMDALILVGSTLATLVAFLALQTAYLFVRLPSQPGNGITYAEYARRGFGQLCAVVTIVAAVILVAERFRDRDAAAQSRVLRRMEFALILAAALVLLSAQRRVMLYEYAYGYTVARVHATAYIVFMSGLLVLLALELRRGGITAALGRRAAALALAVTLVILYWNDQGWIMNRNIDRIGATGKFDAKYASTLSDDALPALLRRRDELPRGAWADVEKWTACRKCAGDYRWYEWNSARAAASAARREVPASSLRE